MKKSFDDILNECIRQLEASGGGIEAVLSKYPEQADELRPYLRVWASLSAAEKAEATPQSVRWAHQQLLSGVAKAEQMKGGVKIMPSIGALAVRSLALLAAGAALALGVAFFTGNLNSGSDSISTAEAFPVNECVEFLDFDGDGSLGVGDIEAFRAAFGSSTGDTNYDPDMDINGDGTIDIQDVVAAVGQVVDCFQSIQLP